MRHHKINFYAYHHVGFFVVFVVVTAFVVVVFEAVYKWRLNAATLNTFQNCPKNSRISKILKQLGGSDGELGHFFETDVIVFSQT